MNTKWKFSKIKKYSKIKQNSVRILSIKNKAKKLGIARNISKISDQEEQRKLKIHGFLTRNSLCKERRSTNFYLLL